MKCPTCGTQNKAGTVFCKICGTNLTEQAVEESAITTSVIASKPAGKTPVGMIIAIVAASVALIGVIILILVLLFQNNHSAQQANAEAITVTATEVSTASPTTAPATEPTTSNIVAVPNVVGMKSTDAYNTLTRQGLKYGVEFSYNDSVPEDYIVSQSPSESKNAILGDTVSLIVSRGSRPAVTAAPAPESSQSSQATVASSNTASNSKDRYHLRASSRYLTRSDLSFLNSDEVQRAINELYAIHGFRFTKGDEKTYFESMSWYHPDTQDMNVVVGRMNSYEKENLKVMAAYRDSLR